MDPIPSMSEITEEEKRVAELQLSFVDRLRKSAYYLVETTKSTGQLRTPYIFGGRTLTQT